MAVSLISKFRGCLIGSHVGDCLGAPFEGDYPISISVLSKYIKTQMTTKQDGSISQVLPYTDDTAMTLGLGRSLVSKRSFDAEDMGKRFAEDYFNQPRRGYGDHVVDIFRALNLSDFKDVFEPAKRQFNGTGSYGNGAAMRIAPAALYSYNKNNEMLELVKQCSLLTHTHQHGYNGAILQCLAIDQALRSNPATPIDPVTFVNRLLEHMVKIEEAVSNVGAFQVAKPYCTKLEKMKEAFENSIKPMSTEVVVDCLGNSVSAAGSVPTAIYSFLRGLQPLDNFESENPFVRTMFFSISVGGDTDTIAAMAGSIAGAYHGEETIPKKMQESCESINDSKNLSDELYALCCGS